MSPVLPSKPPFRPVSPNFSCGPCSKHPGWSWDRLKGFEAGRSHRSTTAREKLKQVIEESKELLALPAGYRVAIMAGSDTGAFEAAMWSLLGPRPVDVFAWEAFGKEWMTDCLSELKPLTVQSHAAPYGQLPDLAQAKPDHDVIFTWNGTAGGAIVPNGDWIAADRTGLTFCDATSSVFAVPMPWDKLDVVTYSWQKGLGGEPQHGMLILSPRAVARLESHTPAWPIPKIFRLTKEGKINAPVFEGETLNTPSMMCVEDVLAALRWVRSIGGAKGMYGRVQTNFRTLSEWVDRTPWIDYLAADAATRSPTSVCLCPADPAVLKLEPAAQKAFFAKLVGLVESEKAGYDFNAYRDAPAGLRIWCGGTVEATDLRRLTEWLDWAYAVCKADLT